MDFTIYDIPDTRVLVKNRQEKTGTLQGMTLYRMTLYLGEEVAGHIHFRIDGNMAILNTGISANWSFVPSDAISVNYYIRKKYKGIGRSLINHALSVCAKQGVKSMHVYNIRDREVEEFYRKCDFYVYYAEATRVITPEMTTPSIQIVKKRKTSGRKESGGIGLSA